MAIPRFHEARHVLMGIERTHRFLEIDPGDRDLAHALPIPLAWASHDPVMVAPPDGVASAGRPEILGLFTPAHGPADVRVVVSVSRPPFDVCALEWTRLISEAVGWEVLVARWLEHPSALRFEIGAQRRGINGMEVRRSTGLVDGDRIFRVDTCAPLPRWPEVHDLLWPCGVLLELEEPRGEPCTEPRRRVPGPLIRFEVPQSWHVRAGEPIGAHASWTLSLDGSLPDTAALRVDATLRLGLSSATPARRRRSIRASLRTHGLYIEARTRRIEPPPSLRELAGLEGPFVALARSDAVGYEARIVQRELVGVTVDYVMLAPPAQEHALDWLRAIRALEIAVATTQSSSSPGLRVVRDQPCAISRTR